MSKIHNYLVIIFLITLTKQDCLEQAALKGLGFVNIKTSPEKINNSDVCGELFANVGFCVDPEEVKKKLENTQIQIKGKMDFTGDFTNLFSDLEVNLKDKEDQKAKIQTLDTQFQEKQDSCYQAIQKINLGAICYLASGSASSNTTITDKEIKLQVNNQSTGVEMEKCLPMYDAMCLFQTGKSITSNTEIKTFEATGQKTEFQQACEKLSQFSSCVAGSCEDRLKALIEDMKPTDLEILPQKEIIDNIQKQFDEISQDLNKFLEENFGTNDNVNINVETNLDDQLKNKLDDLKNNDLNNVIEDNINKNIDDLLNSFRRLQGDNTYKVVMQSSSSGENVVELGAKSGIEIDEKAKSEIYLFVFWGFVYLMFNQF